ncbi:MAG: RcnB family protein [Proteobacteria bacterium]|nr:RcnB family protein [Pseudomonadota bacterium]
MKRIATMALAAATLIAPLATPISASAQEWRDRDYGRYDRDRDRDYDRDRDRDRDYDRDRDRDHRRWCDRDRDGDCDRWDRHDRGRHRGWDRDRYNGYSWQGRWYYGPPPEAYYGRYGYEPGYRDWRRGDVLPYYYRNQYAVVDYRAYRLRPPPYGCHYVRDDRGRILLVGIATGVILSAIINNY